MREFPGMDNLDRIMEIMSSAFDPYWGEAWNRKQVTDALSLPTSDYILINSQGVLSPEGDGSVGFLLFRKAPGEEEVLLLGVCPDYRGNGLGTILLSAFIEGARKRGAEKVFLEMRENNPARSLYASLGFEQIGCRREYYKSQEGIPIDAITFGKLL